MIEDKLARFAHQEVDTKAALAVLRLSFLDWCAVAWAGRDEPIAQITRDQAFDEGGAGKAGVIGSDTRIPARAAALVNGTISHALDYDDTHFAHIGHPSVAVIPAGLAVGEMSGATGQAVHEAALIGAEASIRTGVWLGRAHYQTGFHQTATAGAFGACLTACRLLGLTVDQTKMALGLTSTRASGLKSQFGTMGKPLNAGLAAANGVEAALWAQRGFVSAVDGMSGAQGFAATHHGDREMSAMDGIGKKWLFERVSHKFHACCHGLHALLEALVQIEDVPVDDIAKISIETHPRWLSVCNIACPTTGLEAKFSYRMTAAMRLLGHNTSLPNSFTEALCHDTDVVALRNKVEVTTRDTLSEMQANVVVTRKDGTRAVAFYDLDAAAPLEERAAHVRTKAEALMGAERAGRVWSLIQDAAAPGVLIAALAN